MGLIKLFSDTSKLEFKSGRFDNWCIYLTRPNKGIHPPLDIDYFTDLIRLSGIHGAQKIYDDFVEIYDLTTKNLEQGTLEKIETLCVQYGNDALEMQIILTTIYAGMIAEENKAFTKLGKKIKRLGIHQILFENVSAVNAANFSKGKGWRDILAECNNRNF